MSSDFCFECGRDLPGDHLGWCSSNAPTPIDYTEPTRHARRSDPATSKQAAARLDHTLADHHRVVLDWLDQHGPATDDQIAQAMVDADLTTRTETARRWVRTLREEHHQIVPAMGTFYGGPQPIRKQIQLPNPSGRLALAWTTRTPERNSND